MSHMPSSILPLKTSILFKKLHLRHSHAATSFFMTLKLLAVIILTLLLFILLCNLFYWHFWDSLTVFHRYFIKKSWNAETSTSLFLQMQINFGFSLVVWNSEYSSIGCMGFLEEFLFLIVFLWYGLNYSVIIADKILNHFVILVTVNKT